MKEGTANLEKIGEFSVVWKGKKDDKFEEMVREQLTQDEGFDPWDEHGTLFMRDGGIFFFGWKVEMQGGVIISIAILEDPENRKKFIALLWNFLRSTSKYWDELVEEVLNFSIIEQIDFNDPVPIQSISGNMTFQFETINEFGTILWNLLEIQPFILLNAHAATVGKDHIEIQMNNSPLPTGALQQTISSSSPILQRIGILLLNYLSSLSINDREQAFKTFTPLLNELKTDEKTPSLQFISKYSNELKILDSRLLETLTQDAIPDFIVERSKFADEDLFNFIHLAELLHDIDAKETALMIIGSVLELALERQHLLLLKGIARTISKWGGQQVMSFLEALSAHFPNPEGEAYETLAEIYLLFTEQMNTKEEIFSLANALCTIGRVEEAIQLRLRDFKEINEEMQSLEIIEILTWVASLPGTDEKSLADLLTPYLIAALDQAPAGPILVDRIEALYLKLIQSLNKHLILSFTVAIVKNIEKVPILEQVKVLRIIKEHLKSVKDFVDLVAMIDTKLLDLMFEEDEEDPILLDELMAYVRPRQNQPSLVLPIIEKLLVTAGKHGKYNLYLQVLGLAGNLTSEPIHRHRIFDAMNRAAIEAAKRNFKIQDKHFAIQVFYDIMDMSVLNEDVETLSNIMEIAIDIALSVKDEESLITFYRMFFTIRQMAGIPWVEKLLQLLENLVANELFDTARTMVNLSLELNTDLQTKERILKKQLNLEEISPGYLTAEELVQIKRELIEIYRQQNRVDDVLEELKTGHRELIQKGEAEMAYNLAIEGIDLIGTQERPNQKSQFSELVVQSFLRMVENYEVNPTVENASTFINYAPKIIEATSSLPPERVIEMIELAVDELLIAYIRSKERKHIEYAQILMIRFGKSMQSNYSQLARILTKILDTKQKFEPEYSLHIRFMDRLRFYQAVGRMDEAVQELRSLLQTYKRNASKKKRISSELLAGLYVIGSYYYIMDCEFDEKCKTEIAILCQSYLESIMGLLKTRSSFSEKITELYKLIQQNPSEVRTLVFHLDQLIRELEGNLLSIPS